MAGPVADSRHRGAERSHLAAAHSLPAVAVRSRAGAARRCPAAAHTRLAERHPAEARNHLVEELAEGLVAAVGSFLEAERSFPVADRPAVGLAEDRNSAALPAVGQRTGRLLDSRPEDPLERLLRTCRKTSRLHRCRSWRKMPCRNPLA